VNDPRLLLCDPKLFGRRFARLSVSSSGEHGWWAGQRCYRAATLDDLKVAKGKATGIDEEPLTRDEKLKEGCKAGN